MKTGALIVAAGSAGLDSNCRPLLQIGSLSVVQRLCMTFHLAGAAPIVVMASKAGQQELSKHLAYMQVVVLADADDPPDLLSAVKVGLPALSRAACDRILVAPVDVPMFTIGTVKELLAHGGRLAVPVCEGHKGYPIVIGAKLIPAILQYEGENGLRGAVEQCGANTTLVAVNDSGIYIQSDRADECERIAVDHDLNRWRPVMKLRVARESVFLGPGCWQLMSLVQSTGSVRTASEHMGLSYSKAWKILNNLEKQAGYRVIERQQGGPGGGASSLTQQGKCLMEWYEQMEARCNKAVNEIFRSNPPPADINPARTRSS